MKAIMQERYGSPDVLQLREVDIPRVADDGVLVEVHAAAVNALDWHATRGMPYIMRLGEGVRAPKSKVRGVDLAGRVAAVGQKVTGFHVGDEVFGGSTGSFAEYAVTTTDRLAKKPQHMTYVQAAALHVAGMTALQGLTEQAKLQAGQRILIFGAGGGVGTMAVQIAKALGAHVTAVTRAESVATVQGLGADEVIDYRNQDFSQRAERYHAIFDIGGTRSFAACRRVLADDGVMVVVGSPAGRWLAPATRMLQATIYDKLVAQRFVGFISRNDAVSLASLAELAASRALTPVIEREFDLADAPAAIRHVGEGRARGKIAIAIR